MGFSAVAPPHIDARNDSLVVFCKLYLDILIQYEPVAGYRAQLKYIVAPLGIPAVQRRSVGIEDQSSLVGPGIGGQGGGVPDLCRLGDSRERVCG